MNQWHLTDIDSILRELDTSLEGISTDEATARFEKYGPNKITESEKRGALLRFLLQFHDILIYVLISAGVVTTMLGHLVDSAVIFGVVFLNAIIGFIQEGKAEGALAAIKKMLPATALVIRSGRQVTIPAEQLVPGDVVLLQSGDRVPADLRLFRVKALQEFMACAVLCNDAVLEDGNDGWKVHGDPMEGALLVAGMKVGLDIQAVREAYPRKDLIPFESEHRFMATLQHSHEKQAENCRRGLDRVFSR